jgi:hypothetical protein
LFALIAALWVKNATVFAEFFGENIFEIISLTLGI